MITLDKYHWKIGIMLAVIFIVTLAGNWNNYKSGRAAKFFANLSTPYAGEEEVLPAEVQSLVALTRKNDIRSIGISDKVMANRFISSPIIESIYPAVVIPSSNVFISYLSEGLPASCSAMNLEKGIQLVTCP